ncbi:chorismate--pyruvate lyase family protein [Methylotenera sp. G11]|uniref:chorismate--pyruvate lyase family protein n=1 Tax=Methylotenera sp. G11 TaxID=1506585 RepID=UPI001F002741|nr:chorismate lyase [Methylotenera sp. G11]
MKINQIFSHSRQRWLNLPLASHQYHRWLIERGSLTARLQQRYPDFHVKPVCVRYRKPAFEEAALLHMTANDSAQVRQVLLYGNGRPVVFAHSVLPRRSLQGEWRSLGRLGNKPLGAVLFASPKVKRTPLRYKKLTATHALYREAIRHVAGRPEYLWARRSIFSLNCASIMVTEVFLPGLE